MAVAALLLFGVSAVHADPPPFLPIQPVNCFTAPYQAEVDYRYTVGASTGRWDLPANANSGNTDYGNNINHRRVMIGNAWTSHIFYRFSAFATESGYDYMDYGPKGGPYQRLTGAPATPVWKGTYVTTSLGYSGAELHFRTDYSIGATGFDIDRLGVCTIRQTPLQGYPEMTPARRHDGVLLGTGDVVYMKARLGSTKAGDSCSLAHDTFVMRTLSSGDSDFDVYVKITRSSGTTAELLTVAPSGGLSVMKRVLGQARARRPPPLR